MSDKVQIIFNGVPTSVLLPLTVAEILQQGQPLAGKFLAVLNGDVVPKSLYESTALNQGDEFETIVAISGG